VTVLEGDRLDPLAWETPYQVALVVSMLEALAVLAFFPSEAGVSPVLYQAMVAVRAGTLVGLAFLVRAARPRAAWPALLAWGAMLLAPELWAHAAQAAPASFLVPAFGSFAYALAAHGLARLLRPLWPALALLAVASVVLLPGAYGPYGQLLGEGVPFWVLGAVLVAGLTFLREEVRA
jgi:hypothetical protein